MEQSGLTGLQNQRLSEKKNYGGIFCPKSKNIPNIEQSVMTFALQFLFALLLLRDPAVHADLLL